MRWIRYAVAAAAVVWLLVAALALFSADASGCEETERLHREHATNSPC